MLCVLRQTLMDDHVRDLADVGRDKPDVSPLIRSSRLPATVRGHEGPRGAAQHELDREVN